MIIQHINIYAGSVRSLDLETDHASHLLSGDGIPDWDRLDFMPCEMIPGPLGGTPPIIVSSSRGFLLLMLAHLGRCCDVILRGEIG